MRMKRIRMKKLWIMERDKNYDLELAKYIWSILKSNLPVLMSWGVEIETVKVITCGLEFRVNGFKHTGKVQIVLNEGADLFEVVPSDPYTSDDLNWTNNDSRVSREHNDEGLRAVALESTDVDGWDDYDTVFIGYPIWWGIAAWPMSSFVAVNEKKKKNVVPFCTSLSSGIGQSGKLLAELADAGTWLDGQRFSHSSSEADIASWVNGLNL